MATLNDDEDFWYDSEKRSFSFESNEVDNLFGVSKSGTAQLRAGISNIQINDILKYNEPQYCSKPLLSIISDNVLLKILEADKLQFIQDQSYHANTKETVKKILVGQFYSLQPYSSLASKRALLDTAIKSGNGNSILGITLFIKKTLRRNLVQNLLIERPQALHAYIYYLSTRMCINEISDLLTAQGKTTDAAIRCLNIVLKRTDNFDENLDSLFLRIHKHYNMFFSNLDCKESVLVKSYVMLLEWQKTMHNKLSEPLSKNASTLECLRVACKDYWKAQENNNLSPLWLLQNQEISPYQYQKMAVKTRASIQAWDDIDNLLHKKGWLGGKKLQSCLPIEEVLKILQEYKAPSDVIENFLSYVDSGKRLDIAKNLNCHKAVINILGTQGDRTALLEYKSSLRSQSEEYFYAERLLYNTTIKWRN